MKKNMYKDDIEDTFGDVNDSKRALSIAKKIKSSQKKAFPTVEFKQHLGDKLSNIYMLAREEDISKSFSLTQIFGAFASLIFIFGGVFSFYQMKELSDLSKPYTGEDFSNQSVPFQKKIKEIQEIDSTSLQDIQSDSGQSQYDQSNETSIQGADTNRENGAPTGTSLQNTRFQEQESIETVPSTDESRLCAEYMGIFNQETGTCTLQFGSECRDYDETSLRVCYEGDITSREY